MTTIRPRNAKAPFEIHHDEDGTESLDGEDQAMEESRDERDHVDVQEEEYTDSSDEDEVPDPSLQEDMLKFQETFTGITERFRLVGRIGEGKSIHICSRVVVNAI